jgi:methionyl-tRNA formyltransferase
VTKAPKITREMCKINWSDPAEKIVNQARAFSPYPGAFTFLNGKIIKIYSAVVSELDRNAANGDLYVFEQKLFCKTNTSWLEVLEVQLEGKKRLKSADFLRGYPVQKGTFTKSL